MVQTFEVTAFGFDASTDATDDRVFWVKAHGPDEVSSAITGTNALFHGPIDCEECIDFWLPDQARLLKAKLLGFEILIVPKIGARVTVKVDGTYLQGVVTGLGNKDGKTVCLYQHDYVKSDGSVVKADKWAWLEQLLDVDF